MLIILKFQMSLRWTPTLNNDLKTINIQPALEILSKNKSVLNKYKNQM